MLKKIFSLAVMAAIVLISFNSTTSAAEKIEVMKVATIIEPPIESFERPEPIYDSIQNTTAKIFKNAPNYDLVSMDETAGYVQVHREENNLDAETFIKKADIEELCQKLGYDYAIYMRITNTVTEAKGISDYITQGNSLTSVKVVFDFRIWDNDKKDFTYTKRIAKTGYKLDAALNECLKEIEKDSSKIRAAM